MRSHWEGTSLRLFLLRGCCGVIFAARQWFTSIGPLGGGFCEGGGFCRSTWTRFGFWRLRSASVILIDWTVSLKNKELWPIHGCPFVEPLLSLSRDWQKGSYYERGPFVGGISRISKISEFSRLSRKWSDSPFFSTVWWFSRISKFSRSSRKWTCLTDRFSKRPLFCGAPFGSTSSVCPLSGVEYPRCSSGTKCRLEGPPLWALESLSFSGSRPFSLCCASGCQGRTDLRDVLFCGNP